MIIIYLTCFLNVTHQTSLTHSSSSDLLLSKIGLLVHMANLLSDNVL